MTKNSERRALPRFGIPDSTVLYKKNEGLKLFQRYSNISNLVNLTKSGMCLQIKNGIKPGERVKIQLDFPGVKKMEVKGHVRWKSSAEDNFNNIGIQFEPLKKKKKLNSVDCLEKLREISENYLH